MATRTQSRPASRTGNGQSRSSSSRGKSSSSDNSSSSDSSSSNTSSRDRSAFSWGDNAGPLLGAAFAGAAIGFAANYGRKFLTQAVSGISGDWDQILSTEHDMARAVFDKMLATDSGQTWKRSMLLMQLTHMLDKHDHEEEMVLYPALREADQRIEADQLNSEHGYMKTFLYELGQIGPDSRQWLDKVREFRDLFCQHVEMEEHEVFPAFKRNLSEQQNAKITALINKEGFWQA